MSLLIGICILLQPHHFVDYAVRAFDQPDQHKHIEEMTVQEHMDYYMNQGIDKKEAMKKVAKDRGVGKRDIYKELL